MMINYNLDEYIIRHLRYLICLEAIEGCINGDVDRIVEANTSFNFSKQFWTATVEINKRYA